MKRIVFIQNLIAPYRSHFFNILYSKDSRFKVYYMGKTEKDRNWKIEDIKISHDFWLDRWGIYFTLLGFHIHINPILVLKVLCSKSVGEIILGGSWCDLNVLALVLAKRLRLTKKRYHIWAEANYLTSGARNDNRLKQSLRCFVYGAVDGFFIVPGKMALITFEKWRFPNINHIILPNTIDERSLVRAEIIRKASDFPVFLLSVRLLESVKGIKNFFEAIGAENVRKAQFIIAGDGPDRNLYERFIVDNQYQEHIFLKGFCNSLVMSALYNSVDAVILPSFSDPSPLSLVEALYYHLPILCSTHCGNHYEAVSPGENGYVFSPLDGGEIKFSFERLIGNRPNWPQMGEKSFCIYKTVFDIELVVEHFVSTIKN